MTAHRALAARLGRGTIAAVVGEFYERLRTDPDLGRNFVHVTDWEAVKARIAEFWWRDLGGERAGPAVFNPHAVHRRFGVRPEQVGPWLAHFEAVLRARLPADAADIWLARARRMGEWVAIELSGAGVRDAPGPPCPRA
jgi:hemoglobin